jgi:hypothetical protein
MLVAILGWPSLFGAVAILGFHISVDGQSWLMLVAILGLPTVDGQWLMLVAILDWPTCSSVDGQSC